MASSDVTSNGPKKMDKDDDAGKLFVGGLSWETNAEKFREYFTKYGEVESVDVKMDFATKKSRGFGFVKFVNPEDADKVLLDGPHTLDGKIIDPKKAQPAGKPPNLRTKKIFVGGLKPEITEDDLREYFNRYGKVESVSFVTDQSTSKRRGFCFVEFDNEDSVNQPVKIQFHDIRGQKVEVKYAVTREQQHMLAAKGVWSLTPLPAVATFGRGRGRGTFAAPFAAPYTYALGGSTGLSTVYPTPYDHLSAYTSQYSAAAHGAFGAPAGYYTHVAPPFSAYPDYHAYGAARVQARVGGIGPVSSYTKATYHPYAR